MDSSSEQEDDGAPIIDELLCFIVNKFHTMNPEEIALLCTRCFKDEEIGKSKQILRKFCTKKKVDLQRYKRRTGAHKGKRNIEDIIAMLHDLGSNAPVIVAKELHKLPPISFDTIDVTYFLHRMEKLEAEFITTRNAFKEYIEKKDKEILEVANQV